MKDIAIKIKNISKEYSLGEISSGTLARDLTSSWAKFRNKVDPNSIIKLSKKTNYKENEKIWALRNINLNINKGDIIGIIGKNGAGKSTLLKILSRITSPTHGQIKIYGKIASLLEVGTGFHPELTGRENIFLNGAI
ncbi:ATP-binding cassette domain-containing protein, partial [Candidatus Marinimicrobia bacterium]|nr:ATP-binding cassette domain-containing protein [Candidatus Neomarinimicrobiota bacterium]